MSSPLALAAQEELRAARDARYRANIHFAVTQARRIVVLIVIVAALAGVDRASLECAAGPMWGARDALLGTCAKPHPHAVQESDSVAPTVPDRTSGARIASMR